MNKKILNRVLIVISITFMTTAIILLLNKGLSHTRIENNLLLMWSIICIVASVIAPIKLKKVLTYSK